MPGSRRGVIGVQTHPLEKAQVIRVLIGKRQDPLHPGKGYTLLEPNSFPWKESLNSFDFYI